MSNSPSDRNPFDHLAEDFASRLRKGEEPSLTEYADRYPELSDEIRKNFPAIALLERLKRSEVGANDAQVGAPGSGRQTMPERLGDYRIVRELGRGGMGVVYEAEQESLGRRVALKVLPFHSTSDPVLLSRFLREARAAARFHHTNIVPVFDVGHFEGVHYYAMQYIEGRGLNELFEELRRLRSSEAPLSSGPPSEKNAPLSSTLASGLAHSVLSGELGLPDEQRAKAQTELINRAAHERAGARKLANGSSTPVDRPIDSGRPTTGDSDLSGLTRGRYYHAVARIGVHAADALGYAHSHRVLHRDVKPANLLLDRTGTVWLTDFGLAKIEGDELTRTGDVVGTLRYVAPERFAGRTDERSDVYGLGLTLYELATLRVAFTESDRHRLVRQIMHDEPPAPRFIDRHLPRDLETIIVKAIAKEPHLRYQSADLFAQDLQSFLGDRPILARRMTWLEYTWRWCRRNPLPAALSAVVLFFDRTSSPAPLAFSPDGKILAVAQTMTDVVLLDAETFRELATLHAREPLLLSWISFSPDGRWLAVPTGAGVVQLWDLHLMARGLNSLGLDDRFLHH
jgi:serine/threonine protein kinase